MSFSRTSEALCLTPSAVSHQIRKLEEELGIALFHRGHRRIELTEAGAVYAASIRRAFDEIRVGTEKVRAVRSGDELRVSSVPAFAHSFLFGRLAEFERDHPSLRVRLDISHRVRDFDSGEFDVGIRYGRGRWPGLRATKLLELTSRPVCHPSLLERPDAPSEPQALVGCPLIAVQLRPHSWQQWFEIAGVEDVSSVRFLWVDSLIAGIQAAEGAQGYLLAPDSITRRSVEAGRLVHPFGIGLESKDAYYVVCQRARAMEKTIALFRDWLVARVAEE
ncbi:MAG: LysR substrate-binding domain-containing protein [Proteobacteria bacterium]|nr:LysR substrate-binding domain-containing protein [Pseudomonadota bacterium]